MTFLASIGLKVWGYVAAAVAVVVGLLTMFGRAKQAGRDEVAGAVNKSTADANARMVDAAVQAPGDRQGVANDARKGRF